MKKKISVLTAVLLSLSLAACGGTTKTIQETSPAPETAAATTAAAAAPAAAATTAAAAPSLEAGGGDKNINTDGFLTVALNSNVNTADVHKTSSDYLLPLNIFDRLVEVEVQSDGTSKVVPSLAEKWDISADGLTYTFHLRKDVKFTNGDLFTAKDAVYSLTRMLGVEGAANGDFVSMIQGADKVADGSAKELAGVKATDDSTLVITLAHPYAGFLACLSTPPAVMLSEKATEAAGDKFGLDPAVTIGSGPFKLAAWTLNDSIIMTRNDNYWKGASKLPGVVVKIVPDMQTQSMMFQTGKLDVLDFDYLETGLADFKKQFPNQIVTAPRVGITYFTFNENNEALKNLKVRQAVSMAVDRQSILDSIWDGAGQLENGIFPKGAIGYNSSLPQIRYDPEGAKKLLAEAGYPNGFDLEISADSAASDKVNQTLDVIAGELKDIGINATVKNYDDATWLATRKAGTLGSFMATWSADYNDPDNFIYTFFGSADNTKLRSLNYPDADVLKRVADARSITDETARLKEYSDLEKKIVADDCAWLPMFSRTHSWAVSDKVTGFTPSWNGFSDMCYYNVAKK